MSGAVRLLPLLAAFAGCGVALQPPAAGTGGSGGTSGKPKVLLWGDSISQEYGDADDELGGAGVKALLAGDFDVYVLPQNAQTSRDGLAHVEDWLRAPDQRIEAKDWAIIHFNHGIHDTASRDLSPSPTAPAKVSLDEYRTNLTTLVAEFRKRTTAKLLFATTTPRPANDGRAPLVSEYNAAALDVMNAAMPPIPIDDLFELVTNTPALQNTNDVHFTVDQRKAIAAHVADAIRSAAGESSR